MVTPHFLRIGDTIGIVSTARKITSLELKPLIDLIEAWGLKYILGSTINAESNQYAGDDLTRIADFQEMLDNPKATSFSCMR